MVVAEAVRWIKFIDLFVIDIFRYSGWRKSERFNIPLQCLHQGRSKWLLM
jgi:hypothetical protein